MQKKYFVSLFGAVVFLFLLSACEESRHNDNPPIQLAPPSDSTPPPSRGGTPACYLSTCFETTNVSQIIDPKEDYKYRNPEEFSDASMRAQYIQPSFILDLKDLDKNTKLAPNFTLADFMSIGKGRYALFSADVLTIIQLIRNEVNRPVYITSGYRSPGYNKNIAAAATWSRHTYGDALDFYIDGLSISDLPEFCIKHNASFTLKYEHHIHCDWRKNNLDPAYYETIPGKIQPSSRLASTAKMIADQSRIVFKYTDTQIEFSTRIAHQEDDEGIPTHEWLVTLPNSEIIRDTSPVLVLPKLPGTMQIQVTVGGSIHLEESLTW